MKTKITSADVDFILESLRDTQIKFENYEYPSYEFRQERIKIVTDLVAKLKELKKELSGS